MYIYIVKYNDICCILGFPMRCIGGTCQLTVAQVERSTLSTNLGAHGWAGWMAPQRQFGGGFASLPMKVWGTASDRLVQLSPSLHHKYGLDSPVDISESPCIFWNLAEKEGTNKSNVKSSLSWAHGTAVSIPRLVQCCEQCLWCSHLACHGHGIFGHTAGCLDFTRSAWKNQAKPGWKMLFYKLVLWKHVWNVYCVEKLMFMWDDLMSSHLCCTWYETPQVWLFQMMFAGGYASV